MIPITQTKFFSIVEKKKLPKFNLNARDFMEIKPTPEQVKTTKTQTLLKKEDFLQESTETYIKILSFINQQFDANGELFEPKKEIGRIDLFLSKLKKNKIDKPKFSFKTHVIVIQEVILKK